MQIQRLILFLYLAAFSGSTAAAQDREVFTTDVSTENTPWTHLNFDNDPSTFRFAIVSDRSGGAREGVFEDAVQKLNWLRPEFVMSVGDLIDGTSGRDSLELDRQWAEHFDRIEPLRMPFFHIPGNHDIKASNAYQVGYWNKLFGTPFYAFTYKDVLFLALFTNEGFQSIGEEQLTYFEQALEQYSDARWTLVFMHHPLWIYPHESNFDKIEALLADRDYTVFAGHHHRYHQFDRNDTNYYILATTGGGSPLLGDQFGMFDHITWVTMSDEGPTITNLRLDGILPHDISNDASVARAQQLIESVFFEVDVFLDNPEAVSNGKALLTYTNTSDLPLHLSGRFFHNHYVQPHPATVEATIPPHSRKTVEVTLESIEPFSATDGVFLEIDGTLQYDHEDYAGLSLSGTNTINIRPSAFDALPTRHADFIDTYRLEMPAPLPGTQIHYTLDGSTPTPDAPIYRQPLELTEATTVQAALFDENGWSSTVDRLEVYPVTPGAGVLRAYYEYDTRKGGLTRVPDFSTLEPTTIRATHDLALETAGEKQEFFGLVDRGFITLPETGTYTFSTVSDDGSILFINGEPVVIDAVKHKARETSGQITLDAGRHAYEVHYFQHRKGMVMDVFFETPGGSKHPVDGSMLSFGPQMSPNVLPGLDRAGSEER